MSRILLLHKKKRIKIYQNNDINNGSLRVHMLNPTIASNPSKQIALMANIIQPYKNNVESSSLINWTTEPWFMVHNIKTIKSITTDHPNIIFFGTIPIKI